MKIIKNSHYLQILVLVLWLGLPSSLQARCYYVSWGGGSDQASGTSPQLAWKSLQRVASANLLPGDTVLLARGHTWPQSLALQNLRGTPEQPITISAFGHGPPPRLQPTNAPQVLLLKHCHFTTVEQLHLRASPGEKGVRIAGDSRFSTLQHCLVQGHPDASSEHGITYASASGGQLPTYPTIAHNEVSFFKEAIIGVGGLNQGGRITHNYAHSTTPRGTDLIRAVVGDFEGLTIAHNHLTGWGDDAIDLFTGSNVILEHNRIHTPRLPLHPDGSGNAIKLGGITRRNDNAPPSVANTARYNLIYDLPIRDNDKGFLSNGIDTNGCQDATVYGNLIYNVQGNAINVTSERCRVFNNTAISARVALYLHTDQASLLAYNNILSGGKRDVQVRSSSAQISGSHNLLVHQTQRGNYRSQQDRYGDPRFVNPRQADFALQPNSPAINHGTNMDEYQLDRTGKEVRDKPDIGAMEWRPSL